MALSYANITLCISLTTFIFQFSMLLFVTRGLLLNFVYPTFAVSQTPKSPDSANPKSLLFRISKQHTIDLSQPLMTSGRNEQKNSVLSPTDFVQRKGSRSSKASKRKKIRNLDYLRLTFGNCMLGFIHSLANIIQVTKTTFSTENLIILCKTLVFVERITFNFIKLCFLLFVSNMASAVLVRDKQKQRVKYMFNTVSTVTLSMMAIWLVFIEFYNGDICRVPSSNRPLFFIYPLLEIICGVIPAIMYSRGIITSTSNRIRSARKVHLLCLLVCMFLSEACMIAYAWAVQYPIALDSPSLLIILTCLAVDVSLVSGCQVWITRSLWKFSKETETSVPAQDGNIGNTRTLRSGTLNQTTNKLLHSINGEVEMQQLRLNLQMTDISTEKEILSMHSAPELFQPSGKGFLDRMYILQPNKPIELEHTINTCETGGHREGDEDLEAIDDGDDEDDESIHEKQVELGSDMKSSNESSNSTSSSSIYRNWSSVWSKKTKGRQLPVHFSH